jgi:hypothetical protein
MQQFTFTKLFMKTHIKNLLSLLLLLGLPGVVQAQDAYSTNADGSIYTYSTNADGSANIVAYAGPPWVVTIPTNINGLTVTTIGTNAFENEYSLTSVTIPNSVTSIGQYAFASCISLTGIYFQGNSPTPTNDLSVFYSDSAIVYYLPGTTGWGAMFDGLPTAPWFRPNLQILNNGDILIQFSGGVPGDLYDVEESSNLLTWTVAATNPANAIGSFSFEDTATAGVPMQFYRVRAAYAFTVGGTLTGLPAGDTVTLQDNGGDKLTLSTNGTFTFPTALPNGQSYFVTVSGTGGDIYQPVVASGSGSISGANVTNVAVQCTPIYTGYLDVDMYNAAVADGTANGGVPAVMYTEYGGPFRVTAYGPYSSDVCGYYYPSCKFVVIPPGTPSCSSTILSGLAIQFGYALVCGPGPYGY